MNLNDVLAQARQNQRESHTSKSSRYSTKVQPPKKLPKNRVDQKAIQAFLKRQRDEEKQKDFEAGRKKAGLLKLRDASKNTRKANSMAKRTKDNLKVYKGEDLLGLHPDPKKRRMNGSSSDLTPEEDRRHKAFMKSIGGACELNFEIEHFEMKVAGINDDDSDSYEPLPERDERKRRKMEKQKVKSRSASNLEFSDLLKLAEEQKNVVSSSGESESENDSDGSVDRYGKPLSVEEKYYRERRKNRELEERLKLAKKKQSSSQDRNSKFSKSLSNFKINKLNPAMSDDAKRAKVKALMESFNKSSRKNESKKPASSSNSIKIPPKSSSNSKSRESTSKTEKRKHESSKQEESRSYVPAKKPKVLPPASSMDQTISSYLKKQEMMTSNSVKQKKSTSQKPHETEVRKSKPEQTNGKKSSSFTPVNNSGVKKPVNPYIHTVVKDKRVDPAKRFIDPWDKSKSKKVSEEPPARKGKCTLSVTSEEVRTNYPGVAREDPYIQAYKKTGKVIQNFTPETIARYKAHMIRKLREQGRPIPQGLLDHQNPRRPMQKQRYGVLADKSDDEYDPELEDFIADDEEDEEVDISSHIKQIFGYDKNKYGRESEWELSKMDASYKDIEKEEKRSLRIAKQEDAREAKLEEERMKRKTNRNR